MTAIRRLKRSAVLHEARHPVEAERGTVAGRVLLEGKPVHERAFRCAPDCCCNAITRLVV